MKDNMLYCHNDLIMDDNSECCAITGKYYRIFSQNKKIIIILNEINITHSFDIVGYKDWFWKITDREYIKMKREEKLKILGIIE